MKEYAFPTGKRNAVSVKRLASILGCNEREARRYVEQLRIECSRPICSCLSGYYYPESPEELREWLYSYGQRYKTLNSIIRPAKRFLKRWEQEACGQQRLDFGGITQPGKKQREGAEKAAKTRA